MKIETNELTGAALDWAVAKCEGVDIDKYFDAWVPDPHEPHFNKQFKPSTNWSQGGPIIAREGIGIWPSEAGDHDGEWCARKIDTYITYSPTPLIAAMRCYVASKLGGEVDVPDELTPRKSNSINHYFTGLAGGTDENQNI